MAAPKLKGERYTTPEGRASYPAVFKPAKKYQSEDEEYRIELLFPKATDLKPFMAACKKALAEKYGLDEKKWPKGISYPFVKQDELIEKAEAKGQATDHYEAGAFFVRFKTNAKNGAPLVVDQQKQEILESSKIYGGAWVKVACQIKINEINGKDPVTKAPTRVVYVTPYLQAVQLVRDGDSFGGRPNVDDMFEPVTFENGIDEAQVDPLG